MLNERRRCPECGQLADIVLEVTAIGTDTEVEHGVVHSRNVNGQGQSSYWMVYGHGGRA